MGQRPRGRVFNEGVDRPGQPVPVHFQDDLDAEAKAGSVFDHVEVDAGQELFQSRPKSLSDLIGKLFVTEPQFLQIRHDQNQ